MWLVFVCGRKYMVWTRGRIRPRCVNKKNNKAKSQKEGWLPLRTDRFYSKQIKSSGKIGRQSPRPDKRVRTFCTLNLLPGISGLRYCGSNSKSQTGDAVDRAKMSSNGDTEELIEHMAPSWNLLYLPSR